MRWSAFREGIEILDKYAEDDSHKHVYAQHEKIWAGPADAEVVSAEDKARLEELGWFVDEESWCCFV